ncbi:MAG: helix-turn-helix domain-containing protein [Bdellovibrionota bacterium]
MRINTINIKDDQHLGHTIRDRRKTLQLTQKDVATYCQLSVNGLSQIELGNKSIRLGTLLKLSKMLGFEVCLSMENITS